ncbi:MAG: menaquinone biosynthesis protein [Candidatus Krumholzibacteriota bacterium]
MAFRVAAVSFLNTIPLIDWFEQSGHDEVVLSRALPSLLGDLLASGEADVALLPVVEIFRGASGGMLPGTGIACRGEVDTVKMFYRGDPARLTTVAVDRGSRTSVALLRILLSEQFGIHPEFTEIEPRAGWRPDSRQGALVIGDRCFEFEKDLHDSEDHDVVGYDLGGAWQALTGLPFVFAAWAVAPGFAEKAGEKGVSELTDLLTTARDHGLARLDEIAAREAAAGRLGHRGEATSEALDYYFRHSLRYVLGDEEMAGLRRFHELCVKHGVVPDGAAPSLIVR